MTDDAKLFTAMQAIERARQKPEYDPGDLIGIFSQNTKEMGYLAQEDFGDALQELKRRGVLKIHNFPNDDNSAYEFHFRVELREEKFRALYVELQKQNPQIADPRVGTRTLGYKGLTFNVAEGSFQFGKVSGSLRPYSAPWSVLYALMVSKEKFVTRAALRAQIITSWNIADSKKRQKRQGAIDIENVIKRLRRKLKMGSVSGAVNPDLIHGDGHNTAYLLKAKP